MNTFLQRLEEARKFFRNQDINLGFRKLMDCASETADMSIYAQVVHLMDWKENHPDRVDDFIGKCFVLIERLENIDIQPINRSLSVIEAKAITKSYGRSKFELGPINISIKKGQVYGLVGENGNGKTTLLRALARELSVDSGELKYRFRESENQTKPLQDYDLRSKLVYIPQRTATWYGSLMDNLKFVLSNYVIAPQEIETRVLFMIARLGLWNYRNLKWSELSSGYKMRFELARTLLRQPEVMLLDEPLANLDVLAQQVILEDLKAICNSLTQPIALILSSQQLYEVEKVSDKVVYLKDGKYTDNEIDRTARHGQLIVEIDSSESRENLLVAFEELRLEKLSYNGGVYLCYFDPLTSFHEVLKVLGLHNMNVTYVRNISSSTRRFFLS